jgi:predicted HTH domain antitoxin
MASVTIELPDFITEDEARLLLAIRLFEEDRISCGKGAQIAGCSKRAFMEQLCFLVN